MDELDSLKRTINLIEYAAFSGYELDRKESCRTSAVMRSRGGDKIIISRSEQGHWIYFSVRDEGDNGTIIDFIQTRTGRHFGQVCQALRAWTGSSLPIANDAAKIKASSKDQKRIVAVFARFKPINGRQHYLERRGIPVTTLSSPRFADKIRTDEKQNVIFPHFDKTGLCGYEIKNTTFTGFSKGGSKGLWFSQIKKSDNRLVIAESAIDALSFAALFPNHKTRYTSIGGALSPKQPELIKGAAAKLPSNSEILIATDADNAGDKLAEQIRKFIEAAGRQDITVTRAKPPTAGSDWNDQLQTAKKAKTPFFPIAHD